MAVLSKEVIGGEKAGPLALGEIKRHTLNLPNDASVRNESAVEIQVDFVRFADGAEWGPDKSKHREVIETIGKVRAEGGLVPRP
jgi:hypothetical protein